MKFVIDVGVGRKVENYLSEAGHDVVSILDIDNTMPDSTILGIAEQEARIVITMDKDFGELVFRSRQRHTGVLLLRLEGATGTEKAEVVRLILDRFGEQIPEHFCIFQNGRLRVRP